MQVQVARSATAPVKVRGPTIALLLKVFENRLDGRHAGARGQKHHGLDAVGLQAKRAQWAFDAQDFLFLHRSKHVVGEQPTWHVAQVQFNLRRVAHGVRRIGDGVAASSAVPQQKINGLACSVFHGHVGRQLQAQHHHVGRHFGHGGHARWHFEHRVFAGSHHLAYVQDAVGLRRRAAGKNQARCFFFGRKRFDLMRAMNDAPLEQSALARTTSAVAAPVGESDARLDGRGQNGLVPCNLKGDASGANGDVEFHADESFKSRATGPLYTAPIVQRAEHATPPTASPPSAPSHRLGQARLLIVGCGQVGSKLATAVGQRVRVLASTSSPARVAELRLKRVLPLEANLDQPATLGRLASLSPWLVYLAPPPSLGEGDPRLARLLQALARAGVVRRLVYVSTSGVYGDAQGAWVDETTRVAPMTARAKRRCEAERMVRRFGVVHGVRVSVLRVPGIYDLQGEQGNPLNRLKQGTPLLRADEDVYTNRIHVDDVARACWFALMRANPQRVFNVADRGVDQRMGEFYDQLADRQGLPRAPRLSRAQAADALSPMAMSFLAESRRLRTQRMTIELRLKLRHPTVMDALATLAALP